MFGYVRALMPRLSEEERTRYQGAYCGLCHCLQDRCGFAARFTLQYDFVFLYLLLEEEGDCRPVCQRRCAAHPLKPRPCQEPSPAMELCADEGAILAYFKLRDGVADEGLFAGLGSRLAAALLRRAYRKARAARPDFDCHVAMCLGELDGLERKNSPQLDRVADTFARLLAAVAPGTGREELDRPRQQLLYHLGRWLYLVDAVDDLEEDGARGRYNPIAARFGGSPDLAYLRTTMDHSLSLAQSAFQLLPRTSWSGILENILYLGLPNVQELVFSGQWGRERGSIRRKRQ